MMRYPAGARGPLPAALLFVLSALLALVLVPAGPAHAYNTSQSQCALQGTTGYTGEGQQTDYTTFQQPFDPAGSSSSKTIHIGMLYVDFPDAAGTGNIADYYNRLSPAANWMWNASHGRTQLDIQAPLNQWLRMPSNSTAYGWPGTPPYAQQQQYVLDAATAASKAGVDLSQYDMLYIVPTTNAATINNSPTYIWDPNNPGVVVGNTTVKWAVTFGQDIWGAWGYKIADHETSHTFGLPDLYAFSGSRDQYVGGWDIMGDIGGPGPQYFGWESWKFGWIDDTQVSCLSAQGTSYRTTLNAVEYGPTSGTYKLAVLRTSATTAYVVESRRSAYDDPSLCSQGVLIYKVDTSTQTGNGPIQVVSNPNAPAPTGSCETQDMDAWQPGQKFTDTAANVTISVVSSDQYNDTVDTSM
jgi:M6 family metalloprotease-like protein